VKQKIIPVVSIIFISIFVILFLANTSQLDKETLSQAFVVDAIYYESEKIVVISFDDTTKKSTSVVLEILGMEKSFQRILN